MSRSFRHTPVSAIANAHSEKADKRHAHRALRAKTRTVLETVMIAGDAIFPVMREVADVASFAKDGKKRFDARAQPERMRK